MIDLISTPDFLGEAINCYTAKENQFEIIHNYEKFGMTSEEMQAYIQPIQDFCRQLKIQFSVILEEFPKIKSLLKLTEKEQQEGSLLWMFHRNLLRIEQETVDFTKEDLAFFEMLNKDEYSETISEEKLYIKDVTELINFLDTQNLEDAYKMRVISIYMERKEISNQLVKLRELTNEIVKKPYSLVQSIVEEEIIRMREPDYLDEILKESIRLHIEHGKKIVLIPSISQYNALGMESFNGIYYLHVGIYLVELIKRSNENRFNDAQLEADLKAISDTTRLKILHMLSMKRMYIQEMAENLKLTPATVSHHINILLSAGYVLLTVDASKSKKVYYELNQGKLEGLSKSILNLANKYY